MPDLPTGTVTFLFTDIEGSTRLLEAQPQEYRDALARHDAILERAIAKRGGTIFQRAGDGVCAAFVSPTEAVGAAFDGQRALHREPWPAGRPIRVRMGLHTGAAEIQGAQYFGLTLHRCSRLMSAAHGGQVLLSNATAALVAGDLPQDATLRDLGEHRLRDLAQPGRVQQLCGPDLPSAFPPLRTLTAIPNNLPVQRTAFIGREQQRRAVREIVLRPDTRLVTLTGPGGTGKTRLGLEAAGDLLDSFEDGVFFVPLAPVTDPDLVLPATAQALGIRETPGRSVDALLADLLGPKRCLLLLDNFEQVVAAAPLLADLIAASPHLKILVTSRAVLRLYGEREYVVPPLSLPDRRAAPTAVHLAQFEAIRLFQDRAQAARADFAVTDENAADVAEICHRLDGLPLAIELAAARIRSLPPRTLLQRMERRLPLLTGGARDLPARQRTLRDAIAWSYDLLEPDEQALFRRLAVFRGCTLETAERVCAGEPPRPGATSVALPLLDMDVLDGVESLVEKSLLRQEQTADGDAWYLMLETVREFAQERLEESGEADAVHRRQILAALALAEDAESKLYGPEQLALFPRLEREHDNIRTALERSELSGYAAPGLRIAAALWWFWSAHGHVSEGRERFASLLTRFPLPLPTARPEDLSLPVRNRADLQAKALYGAGMMASIQGDHGSARTLLEQGLALRRALDDRLGMFTALEGLGTAACFQGDYDAARRYFEEGVEVARSLGDRVYGQALHAMGNLHFEVGELEQARSLYATALTTYVDSADPRAVAAACISLAAVAQEQDRYDDAHALAAEAVERFRGAGDPRQEALSYATLGGIAVARGDLAEARECLRQSIVMHQQINDASGVAMVLERLVGLVMAEGQPETAIRLAASASALRELTGSRLPQMGRAKLEAVLAPARQALSEAATEQAWQEGWAFDVEQAIAAALALTEPPPAQPTAPSPPPDFIARPQPTPDAQSKAAVSALTARELEIASLIAQGLTNRQIAERLVLAVGSVNTHVHNILGKLDSSNRAQIAVWAADHGLI